MNEITKEQALSIFWKSQQHDIPITDKHPGYAIYGIKDTDPCWYLFPPRPFEFRGVGEERVVVISKSSGEVVFDEWCGE